MLHAALLQTQMALWHGGSTFRQENNQLKFFRRSVNRAQKRIKAFSPVIGERRGSSDTVDVRNQLNWRPLVIVQSPILSETVFVLTHIYLCFISFFSRSVNEKKKKKYGCSSRNSSHGSRSHSFYCSPYPRPPHFDLWIRLTVCSCFGCWNWRDGALVKLRGKSSWIFEHEDT